MKLDQDNLENAHNVSLLNKLRGEEISQIFKDHNLYGSVKYTMFIDADDILSYIDPYNLIYDNKEVLNEKELADNFYATNALFEHKQDKRGVYLFDEYVSELEIHKKRFNEITDITISLNKLISNKNLINTQETRDFIEEFFSEIFYILKRKDKSLLEIYNDLFQTKKIKTNHLLEEFYFDDPNSFIKDKQHRERIELIYNLFPNNHKGYSSLLDSICIYKVFLLNQISSNNTKFIYFSSAKKSKNLFNRISKDINNEEWKWLKQILKYNPEEKFFYYRNNKWNFGYIIYHILSKKTKNAKQIFEDYCKGKSQNSLISEILNKKRESIENLSIFADCKLSDEELKYSERNSKNINYLLTEIKNLNSQIEGKKIDLIKEVIFSTKLIQELSKYINEHNLIIDRGKDNIISLFNTLPPLFALKAKAIKSEKFKRFQREVQDLITYASSRKKDDSRISYSKVLDILESFYKTESNLSEMNTLLIIFLLIFIQYESKDKVDSNTLSFDYCRTFSKQIQNKINHLKIKEDENTPIINQLSFILKEINVLYVWTLRRKGGNFNEIVLKHSEKIHKDLKSKYPNDYRFILSDFLSKLNFLYDFKEKYNQDINRVNQYVENLITLATESLKEISGTSNFNNDSYLKQTHKTLINSLGFVYCIRLDLLLHQNKERYSFSRKTIDLINKLKKLKKKRKLINSKDEKTYDENSNFHPVFPYVEAYIEYLESYMNVDNSKFKIERAEESILKALRSVESDAKHRPFFLYCCKILSELISDRKKDLTKPFKSFILRINANQDN